MRAGHHPTERPERSTESRSLPDSVERLAATGVTHETLATDDLGELAPEDPLALAEDVAAADRITEALSLVTCNRVELFVSARTPADRERALAVAHDAIGAPADAHEKTGLAVVEYAARIACGLESKVLGEDHILGQVSRARERATDEELATGALGRVLDAAVSVGRTCRSETGINDGQVSYGSATCELLAGRAGPPERLVLVGAGEMARSVAKAATHRWDARIDVVNPSAAPDLPSEDGTYWEFSALEEAVHGADAVVTSTSASDPVLTPATVRHLDSNAPIVDLANPRDVASAVTETHQVISLDAVQTRVNRTAARRRDAVPAVQRRITDAVDRFVDRERENRAEDTLRALHREAATVRERELAEARNRLGDADADADEVLEDFARALAGSLLATPTERLREAAREGDDRVIEATHRLFELDEDGS